MSGAATVEMWEPWDVAVGLPPVAPIPAPPLGTLLVLDVIRRRKLIGVPGLRLETRLDRVRLTSILDLLIRSGKVIAAGDARYRLT